MSTLAYDAPAGRDALSRLLYALHARGGTATRAELTAELDRGRNTMGYLISELRARGIVAVDEHPGMANSANTASGASTAAGGRPSHRIVVAAQAPYVVAVHLRADSCSVTAAGLGGRVWRHCVEDLDDAPRAGDVLDRIALRVREIMRAREPVRCVGVAVAVPSPIRTSDGYGFAPLHLGWGGVAFREEMVARLPEVPVAVGNDANLAALAEHRHGAGRGARQLLYLTTEHIGIGGGLISEGRGFTGAHGYALEAGHVTVDPHGAACACGSRGCLEVEADQRALLRAAGRPAAPMPTLEREARAVLTDAAAGDERALAAVRRVAERVGAGLGAFVNIVDPDRIVLGGLLADVYEACGDVVRRGMDQRSYISKAERVAVGPGSLPDAALLGAAELALQPLLDDPRSVPVG